MHAALCAVHMLCTITGTVDWNRYHDGNTMFVAGWSVHLLGIDPREPLNGSSTASDELKNIVGNKRLICRVEAQRGNNLRAKCFTSARKSKHRVDVGAEMVRRGFAFDCEFYSHGEYRKLEVPPGAFRLSASRHDNYYNYCDPNWLKEAKARSLADSETWDCNPTELASICDINLSNCRDKGPTNGFSLTDYTYEPGPNGSQKMVGTDEDSTKFDAQRLEEKRPLLKTVYELRGSPQHLNYKLSAYGTDFVVKETGICYKHNGWFVETEPLLSDDRYPVRVGTWNADYSIVSQNEEERPPWCVYRNKKKLLCVERLGNNFTSGGFRTPVRTKDYVLIPVEASDKWSGNYYLISEKRNGAIRKKKIMEDCYNQGACEFGIDRVNYRANEADFHVARKEGYIVTAHFRNGVISVRRQKIDPQKPWENDKCEGLLDMVSLCRSKSYSMIQPTAHALAAFEESYPVAREIYSQECTKARESGKVDPREFVRKFCHRSWYN